ncbi:MAG: SDR family NAD(P)-dependent oxidoreductase [Sphingomonadales bacterium]|nr:SDR family NAD(P)-dependent oxidoreductase [Sphingomonadales bacterium]
MNGQDNKPFAGRVAAVTGAGKGLGRAYAEWLAAHGCAVVVNNRLHPGQASSAQAVVDGIVAAGGSAVVHHGSVDDPAASASLVATALDAFGRLDILVCNAGVMPEAPLAEMPVEDIQRLVSINVLGTILPLRAAWAHMLATGYGRIVLTGSTVGVYGHPNVAAYGATRAGAVGLARSLTLETPAGADIAVNVIMPFAYTNMSATAIDQAMPASVSERIKPHRIAPIVGWLCSQGNPHRGRIFHASSLRATRIGLTESAPVAVDPENLAALDGHGFALDPNFEPPDSVMAVGRLLGG